MRALIVMMLFLLFAVTGCVAPSPSSPSTQATADASGVASQQPSPEHPAPQDPPRDAAPKKPNASPPVKMPPMSDPLPPERVQVPSPTPAQASRSCKTDSDCVVKNVGNCCGYFPACVHKDSPTDPAGVKAQCAKSGMLSVCGFPSIEGCHCARGQCVASVPAVEPSQDPLPSDPVR